MLELVQLLLQCVLLVIVCPRRFYAIVVSAYAVRALLSYIHAYFLVLPDSQFDALLFERLAWEWSYDGDCLDDFSTGSMLYAWIGSCVYIVIGRSALVLQLLNSFLGALVVLVAVRIVWMLIRQDAGARLCGWLVALHPSLLLYSAITMREVAVVLPFMLSLYWFAKWITEGKMRYGSWSILWAIVSQLFHTGIIVATVAITGLIMYYTITDRWRPLFQVRMRMADIRAATISLMIVSMVSVAAVVMWTEGYGIDKITRLKSVSVLDALGDWQQVAARGRGQLPRRDKGGSLGRIACTTTVAVRLLCWRSVLVERC